ncbi:helix-turn-helix domain-containing protein [Kordiimonas pumila]|uniref:LuxR C-terminal-related transcriptional regulator n=1 Tax=Kordiimonas pumila TaxID=2161677 RepID=A0ABV7D5G8_9PROT|nr:helix-turn-helix transcriptional regulator [Kordiimonas pumila]
MPYKYRVQEPSAEIYERILSCETSAEISDCILNPVADLLGARSGVFLNICTSSSGSHHFGARDYVGDAPRSVDVYLEEGLYIRDPVMRPAINWLNGKAAAPTILTGSIEATTVHDAVYRDSFLLPYNIGHVVALAVPISTGLETQLACVGFHRRHMDKGFLPEQINYFQRLGPAIRSALYGLACRESIQLSDALAVAARESGVDMGYLILDEDLVVRNGNARGLDDMGLTGMQPGTSLLLGQVKQRLLSGDLQENEHFNIMATGHATVGVHVRNFHSFSGDVFYLVTTTSAGPSRAIGDACQKYGLTNREAEIALLIATGKCNASLGKEIGISLRTVENHLRSIYRKVGVSSRTQLVSRLLQIH